MVTCEHFLYGHGIGLVKTDGVSEILNKKTLNYLCNLNETGTIQTWLPEGYIAVSHLQNGKDDYGRKTILNHTILIKVEDYFRLHPPTLFEPHFIKHTSNPPKTLEPLRIEP